MNSANRTSSSSSRRRVLFAALCLYAAFACALAGRDDVPPQGWQKDRGPVVPHDSFPTDCFLCHTDEGWNVLRDDFHFDHLAETGVALVGAHADAECLRCHNDRGPVAVYAQRGCAGCHEDVHRGQLGTDCKSCHDENDWRPSEEIAIHNRTRFPLVGSHAAVPCWRCHVGSEVGNFTRVDTDCVTCHEDDLATALNPDHAAMGWVSGCDQCHIPTTWTGAGFNHPGFPLTGAHQTVNCTDCHTTGTFGPLPSNCDACHLSEYTGTTDPNHVSGNFPLDCSICHGTSTWEGAIFSHAGITTGCVDCHLSDYNGTSDPDHAAQGFPLDCEQCHSTNTWQGAMFNHTGITSGCVDCHQDDYDATTDPNHLQVGFPTSCEQCHGTNNWNNATFNHSFPITSGKHSGFDCSDCHPTTFPDFSCFACHSAGQMNDKHKEVGGYAYSNPLCLDCHPNGKSD